MWSVWFWCVVLLAAGSVVLAVVPTADDLPVPPGELLVASLSVALVAALALLAGVVIRRWRRRRLEDWPV